MLLNYRPSLEIVSLIGKIDEFKGSWRSFENISPERLAALKKVATVESIGSSTRIEGSKLSDIEVESILSGLGIKLFSSRDEEEVAGYADLMETIFQNWQNIPFTENQIQQLHGLLLRYSQKDDRHRGHYKKFPNRVEATDGKKTSVIFETATEFETPFLMTELVAWTDENLQSSKIHPLIVVAVFAVKFLAIHPFQDGNGRLSRGLTTLLLLKFGYKYVPYSSMESIIEKSKNSYYLALRRTQESLRTDNPDWEPWILFFLQVMEKQKIHLEEKIKRERILQGEMTPLSAQIVELLRQHGSLKMLQIINLTQESKGTLRTRIKELEEQGKIIRNGQGKNTWYALKLATNSDGEPFWTRSDKEPFWTGDDDETFWT